MAGIIAIVGKTGSGKSYSAFELAVIPTLKQARPLVTNLAIRLDEVKRDYPDSTVILFDEEEAKKPEYWNSFPPGSVICLDEVWKFWPSGTRANQIHSDVHSFLKEHRHRSDEKGRSQEVYLCTQVLDDIAATIRNQIHSTIVCTKLTAVGQDSKFRRDYYEGAIKGHEIVKSKLQKQEFKTYSPEVYQYYKTHTFSDSTGAVDESGHVKTGIFGSFQAKAAIVALLVLPLLVFYFGNRAKTGLDTRTGKISSPPAVRHQPQDQMITTPSFTQPVPDNQKNQKNYEDGWRVMGQYNQYTYLTNGKQVRRVKGCRAESLIDVECEVDGKIITVYTGNLNKSNVMI